MILGAVLAGGQSRRFGSDKALALLNGETLLMRAVDTLSGWCEKVVVVGREEAPAPTLPDCFGPGLGPLAGIAAALHDASDEGYDLVLTCGVGSINLPDNLPQVLSPAPAYLADQPLVGLWQASAARTLEKILRGDGTHSIDEFAKAIGARAVETAPTFRINTPQDLAAVEQRTKR